MSGSNSDYRIPKYPKLQTPISDIGLEPKSQPKREKLDPISNFAEVAKDLPEHTKAELLRKAVYEKDTETVQILADSGANLNPESFGYQKNLFGACCWCGDLPMVRTLLKNGADPNRFGVGDGLPLIVAADNRLLDTQTRIECVSLLLSFGADINGCSPVENDTILHWVCNDESENIELVVFLLLRGADPFRKDDEGRTPAILPNHIRGLTKPFKEAIDAGDRSAIDNCITVLAKFLPDDTATALLVQWAGFAIHDANRFDQIRSLIEASQETLPMTATRHLPDLTKPFLAALNSGNSVAIDRCLEIVTMFLPRRTAANLLVKWAELSIHDKPVAEAIHSHIENYLSTLDGNLPVDVARYVARYNARHERMDVEDAFEANKLTPKGIPIFKIDGYSIEEHGTLPIRLAALYALDPDADPKMANVLSILNFVAKTATETPKSIRIELHNAVVKLLGDLLRSAVPELVERASYIQDFLGKAPFALDS
jgi:hypothetical protein